MNLIILTGRLTRDPDQRYTQDQKAVTRFSIAVDRDFKKDGQPEADFFDCVSFGKQAEFIGKYFSKGKKINLSGRIEDNNYPDQNGVMRYRKQVKVEHAEFGESKAASEGHTQKAERNETPQTGDDFMQIPDSISEELPFN